MPQPAAAQLSAGSISTLFTSAAYTTSPVKGSDVAWDPVNRVYLAVLTCYNTCPYGQVYGVFVNTSSLMVGLPFSIKAGGAGHFPRTTYSQQVNGGQGGFLVVWHEESGGSNLLRTRVVAYSNGTGVKIGSENTINGTAYSWLESAASVAYSPVSQRFLVAWRVYPSVPGIQIHARLVDINGAAVGGLIKLSAGFGRDPSVAWNSLTNEFGVAFGNENAAGTVGFMSFAVVNPSTGTFIRNSFPAIAGFTYVTDLAFNPNTGRYVMTWHQQPGGVPEVWTAQMAADGSVVSQVLITRSWRAYDALSVSYNPVSGSFLLVSLGDPADNIDGTELNNLGVREVAIVNLGPGVSGKYVRAASASDEAGWALSFSDGFRWLKSLPVITTSRLLVTCPVRQPIQDWRATPPVPSGTWICVNGEWVPGASMPTAASVSTPVPAPTPPAQAAGGIVPGPGGCVIPLLPNPPAWHVWKCVDGGWVLRRICTTTLPSPDPSYTCVDGLWEPPVAPSCTTVKPGPDWVCVKGDWLPPRVPEDDEDTGEALSGFAAPHVIAARDDAAYWHGPPAVAEFLAHEE